MSLHTPEGLGTCMRAAGTTRCLSTAFTLLSNIPASGALWGTARQVSGTLKTVTASCRSPAASLMRA